MPAYVRQLPDAVVIEFSRAGLPPEREIVIGLRDDRQRCCERAMLRAVEMLIRRGVLQPGDRLTVRVDDGN
jgi:hypothetical protein